MNALDIEFLLAAESGDVDRAKNLIGLGVRPESVINDQGITPLFFAAQNGHSEMVEFLCANGVQIDQTVKTGHTPLWIAAGHGHIGIVKFLYEKGANLNAKSIDGSTPLLVAIQTMQRDLVKFFLEHGAQDVGFRGQMPLIDAMQKLGYPSKSDGVCYGLSLMFVQAIQSGEVDKFIERMQKIYRMSDEELQALAISKDETNRKMTDDQLDIHSFFQGIELYSSTGNYPELYSERVLPQDIEKALPIVAPQQLLSKNFRIAKNICSAYQGENLKEYFDGIREMLHKNLKTPISVLIATKNHAIVVFYDKDKQWTIMEPNIMPKVIRNISDDEIANVFKDILGDDNFVFSTTILGFQNYLLKRNVSQLQERMFSYYDGLIKSNPDFINATNNFGETALWHAVSLGDFEMVKYLIEKNIDIDRRNNSGFSPAYLAIQCGHFDIFKYLIENGADPFKGMGEVMPAFDVAKEHRRAEFVEYINEVINQPNAKGQKPLMMAILDGDLEKAKYLLENFDTLDLANLDGHGKNALQVANENGQEAIAELIKQELNKLDESGETPLTDAAMLGDLARTKYLIAAGADINLESKNGAPLVVAIDYDNIEVVRFLCDQSSIELNKEDKSGYTPLRSAKEVSKNPEIIMLLEEKLTVQATQAAVRHTSPLVEHLKKASAQQHNQQSDQANSTDLPTDSSHSVPEGNKP